MASKVNVLTYVFVIIYFYFSFFGSIRFLAQFIVVAV